MRKGKQTWKLSEEFLTESAENRADIGDYFGALTMLNKRAGMYPPSADSLAVYAEVYEALELWQLAADAWFHFLDICNEADFPEGYEGLSVAFENLGNEMQSEFYYERAYAPIPRNGENINDAAAFAEFLETYEPTEEPPKLHIVGGVDPAALREGLDRMREGELVNARKRFLEVDKESPDRPSAAGLAAMCLLMLGEEEEAEKECEALLAAYPDNVQALTTYIAVLGARGDRKKAKEFAARMTSLPTDATDDLYRIATAFCETGLHEEAFKVLTELKLRLPYDENILFFYAVAGYHIGKIEEAIASLETLTTIYPQKEVAQYYLEHLRLIRDGEEKEVDMGYFYRVPQTEYRKVANFLLAACKADIETLSVIAEMPELEHCLRIAFDELEGRDEKLQVLAVRVAARTRYDEFLRACLLDYMGSDFIKFTILHDVTARNEENSFGTVFINLYREFYSHPIEIGPKKAEEFLDAFADVYSKYALISKENADKICAAAEDMYAAIEAAGAWRYTSERAALAAAIYRESRLQDDPQSLSEICDMFDANRYVTQEILDFLM